MFELYRVQGLYISNPGVLSLYSYGKFTGIVVDLGHGVSQIVPVFDGVALSHAVMRYNLGGRDLIEEIENYRYNIGQKCKDSIQKCDIDIRKDLYKNIVLSGGTSMLEGLPERLEKEIIDLAPESMKEEVKVIASPKRKYAAWFGGNILSSISSFESNWITRIEYEELGGTIVGRKCF